MSQEAERQAWQLSLQDITQTLRDSTNPQGTRHAPDLVLMQEALASPPQSPEEEVAQAIIRRQLLSGDRSGFSGVSGLYPPRLTIEDLEAVSKLVDTYFPQD